MERTATLIPAQLHTTWKCSQIPPAFQETVRSWGELGFRERLWNETAQASFIDAHFGERYLRAFLRLRPGSFKSDMFRYAVLFHEGGFYHELDTRLVSPTLVQRLRRHSFVASVDHFPHRLHNGLLLGAQPGVSVLRCALGEILEHSENRDYRDTDLDITGPGVLGECLKHVLGRDGVNAAHASGELAEHHGFNVVLLNTSHKSYGARWTGASFHGEYATRATAVGGASYHDLSYMNIKPECEPAPHYGQLWNSRLVYIQEAEVDDEVALLRGTLSLGEVQSRRANRSRARTFPRMQLSKARAQPPAHPHVRFTGSAQPTKWRRADDMREWARHGRPFVEALKDASRKEQLAKLHAAERAAAALPGRIRHPSTRNAVGRGQTNVRKPQSILNSRRRPSDEGGG